MVWALLGGKYINYCPRAAAELSRTRTLPLSAARRCDAAGTASRTSLARRAAGGNMDTMTSRASTSQATSSRTWTCWCAFSPSSGLQCLLMPRVLVGYSATRPTTVSHCPDVSFLCA